MLRAGMVENSTRLGALATPTVDAEAAARPSAVHPREGRTVSTGASGERSVELIVEEVAMGGVSLARYAGVRAGVGEGFDLALVLACEQVAPSAWPGAERAWGARLADELDPTEGLSSAYAEHLSRARERYGRRIRPIDNDVRAWLDFRRGFELEADPPAFLKGIGLTPLEVARLHGTWSRRLAEDTALAEQARAILAEERGPVPALSLERSPLETPPPAAPPELRPETRASTRIPADAPIVGELSVELEKEPSDVPALFVPLPGWPSLDFIHASLPSAPPAVALRIAAAEAPVPIATPLPPATPSQVSAAQPLPAPAPVGGGSPAFNKTIGFVLPQAPALPFTNSASVSAPKAPAPAATVKRASMGATMMGVEIPTGPALPFQSSPHESTASTTAAPPKRGAALNATLAFVLPSGPATPFSPTVQPSRATETVGGQSRSTTPGPTVTAPPRLTLAQHASLTAEIAIAPGDPAAIYKRYGLSGDAELQALNRSWSERLRLNTAEQQEWQRVYSAYYEYLARTYNTNVPTR